MSPSHFDAKVKAGKLPQPHRFGRLVRFDRFELDVAMAAQAPLAANAEQTEPPEFPEPKV
jgi:predicted DNA-binding transcriptional regulator AlpA